LRQGNLSGTQEARLFDRYNISRTSKKGGSVMTKKKTSKKITSKEKKELKKLKIEEAELTPKQKLFCLYYVKTFNATQSAIKAGYSKDTAHVIGCENLKKPNIKAEIARLKKIMTNKIMVSAMDVLNKYAEIAFADIGDYVTFGQRKEQVIGMYGPVYQEVAEEGKEVIPVMQTVNYVDLADSSQVDTALIAEVKQGKDGISVKLHDKMKALEKLEQYFDLLPDFHKRKLAEEKLAIEREKLEIDRDKAGLKEDDEKETGIVVLPDLAEVDEEEGIELGTIDLDTSMPGGGSDG
jgi:phage terminase small subunit